MEAVIEGQWLIYQRTSSENVYLSDTRNLIGQPSRKQRQIAIRSFRSVKVRFINANAGVEYVPSVRG